MQHKILVVGAGKIGTVVSSLLARTGDYKVYLGDKITPVTLPSIYNNPVEFINTDVTNMTQLKQIIEKKQIEAVISCLPYHLTIEVAKLAHACGIHYFDPTEDVQTTNTVNEMAQSAKSSFAPQCGLAPGFISIAANSLMHGFDEIDHVKMRVGALTQNISNSLQYAFTWSIEGVINEYINPCLVLENGQQKLTPALGGLETITLNNEIYEAFHTSGGVGSLVDTYQNRVKNMDYKTMRYPGHCDKMVFMLQHLKLGKNPDLVKQILEKVIPHATQDKVVVYVSVQGQKDGRLNEVNYTNTLYPLKVDDIDFTAIQMTTASGICTVVDMVMHEKKLSGLIKQEQIDLKDFLANRFGSYYANDVRIKSNIHQVRV